MKAIDILSHILQVYGLSNEETNSILARFLQEEAVEYVEAMELCGIDREQLKTHTTIFH